MNWAVEAIEKEALKRAFDQIRNNPQTFSCLGYSQEQVVAVLLHLEGKGLILPNLTVNGITANLDERLK